MLKPAQLYVSELKMRLFNIWYDKKYQYLTYSHGFDEEGIYNNNKNQHQLVSVNNDDDIIGFISYNIDIGCGECSSFFMVSFYDNNITFAKDMYQVIKDIFYKYKFNVIHFSCIADNPAIDIYRKYIKKYGGNICGYQHMIARLMDGEIHDLVMFEILRSDYISKVGCKNKEE